ncbi:putative DNA binding domain-containing protein [bacterium]|nr:putative DNA binding domain-containing protein [bacterium]
MNKKNLHNLIALGEGFTTEFKRSGTTHLGREICAFANATGGVILIGVSDAGDIVEVKDHNRLKSEVQSIARSADPPIAVQVESAGEVLCVSIPAQHSKPYSTNGKFYIREGASTQQMSRKEIREFFFKEGLIHFDEMPCEHWFTLCFRRPVMEQKEAGTEQSALQPESQPESLNIKVLTLLRTGVMSKSELSINLGQQTVSGQLNHVIRRLLIEMCIEYTIPEKPNSRLQQYRLTAKGKSIVERECTQG